MKFKKCDDKNLNFKWYYLYVKWIVKIVIMKYKCMVLLKIYCYMLGFFFEEFWCIKVMGEGGGMFDLYLLKYYWCIYIFR